jgi:hypothetical protein
MAQVVKHLPSRRKVLTSSQYCQKRKICRFNTMPIKIPKTFIHRNWKNNPVIHMESQKTQNIQRNLKKKNRAGMTTLPDFKIYHRPTVTYSKTPAWERHTDKWRAMDKPNPTRLHPADFPQRCWEPTGGERQSLHQIDIPMINLGIYSHAEEWN